MSARLKSVELNGYKTFANKNLFEFAERITAIVGPNGSGKSNIADAMRWVLGEQTFSTLRAKKTEDMIFSGSDLRARAGMASATIVFDNEDNWLPIEYSEIAITRRAYRDGQNEYLLNGQKVRLRDVTDILANSGLAERTYTIIGQGLVDAALSLGTYDRRRLFEEAAGIGLYRVRKEEAIRRLEKTLRNLERVQDILGELEPRLRGLERQAERSKTYDYLKADLKANLLEWYGYHWNSCQKELAEAISNNRAVDNTLLDTNEKQIELDLKIKEQRDNIHALRSQINSWHSQLANYHTQRESISKEKAVLEERQRLSSAQLQNLQLEMQRKDEELLLHQNRLSVIDTERDEKRTEYSLAKQQAQTAQLKLNELETKQKIVAGQVSKTNQDIRQLEADLARVEARSQERRERIVTFSSELSSLVESGKTIQERNVKTNQILANAEATKLQIHSKFEEIQNLVQDQSRKLTEVNQTRNRLMENKSGLINQIESLKARVQVLEQADKDLVGYEKGAQILLQATTKSKGLGIQGVLGGVLDIPSEIETAIGAVLGNYADAVILKQDADITQALDVLISSATRGSVLPLKKIAPEKNLQKPDDQECLGVAASLVGAPDKFRPVIDLLLGRVLVVTDRNAVARVIAGQPPDTRVVTLAGEVYHADGPVHVGSTDNGSGKLGRSRQRREIQQTLLTKTAEQEKIAKNIIDIELSIRELNQGRDELNDRLNKLDVEIRNAEAEVRQAQSEVDKVEQEELWIKEKSSRIQGDYAAAEAEIAQAEKDREKFHSELLTFHEEIKNLTKELYLLSVDDPKTDLTHWSQVVAVAEREMHNISKRQHDLHNELERTKNESETLKQRIEDVSRIDQDSQARLLAIQKEEGDISTKILEIQEQLKPSEKELAETEGRRDALLDEEIQLRKGVTECEKRHTQAQIHLARKQEALDTLRGKIEDDFGLVSFDYVPEISGPKTLPLQGFVEKLPNITVFPQDVGPVIQRQRAQLRRMGPINPEAQKDYKQVLERFDFLSTQVKDLLEAEKNIRTVITELDTLMEREFQHTFSAVAEEFKGIFTRLFGGGNANLLLSDPDNLSDSGIEIEARLPGRRMQGLSLLSGGERSLTATALIFALLKVSPTPFCVLDEVDAMLDEANVGRFKELLLEISKDTQIVVVTHNRGTVQAADVVYGVTMGKDSASQVISLRLDEIAEGDFA